ncbi:MAG: hypothetical protein PHV33_13970 [Elusimicrobiales bacterium]|nr:hypothetical protein [Elusimicrobiales bacterium]
MKLNFSILAVFFFWAGPALAAGEGPRLELTDVLAGSKSIIFEGRAYAASGKASVSYAVLKPGAGAPDLKPVKGEDFSIKVPAPFNKPGEALELLVQAADRAGRTAQMKANISLGYDGKLHYTLLFSKSALELKSEQAGAFTVLYPPALPAGPVADAAGRLKALTRMADEALGMGGYPSFGVLLYSPDVPGAATYVMFRGFTDGDFLFSFPAPLGPGGALATRDYVLDDWVPHELGDHGARQFSPKRFDIRWLSEGTGDYLKALWLSGGRPDPLELDRPAPAKPADLLDGEWSPDHYACSARFIKSLVLGHPGVLKKLFTELREKPASERSEPLARETLSRLVGSDITPALRNCGEAP